MAGKLVKVDRGDGHIFKVREDRVAAFLRRNPSGRVLRSAAQVERPSPAPEAALDELTIAQLLELAFARGVSVPKGPKAAILEALKAASPPPPSGQEG